MKGFGYGIRAKQGKCLTELLIDSYVFDKGKLWGFPNLYRTIRSFHRFQTDLFLSAPSLIFSYGVTDPSTNILPRRHRNNELPTKRKCKNTSNNVKTPADETVYSMWALAKWCVALFLQLQTVRFLSLHLRCFWANISSFSLPSLPRTSFHTCLLPNDSKPLSPASPFFISKRVISISPH